MGKRIIFSRKSTITLIGAAVLCLCAICSVILTNALGLRKAIDQRVQSYLQDVSVQSTQVADSRIHTIYSNLHTIADSLAVLSDEERDSFISRSHYYTDNFDEIILIRADGASESSSGSKKDFSSNPAFERPWRVSSRRMYTTITSFTCVLFRKTAKKSRLLQEKRQSQIGTTAFRWLVR